MHGEGKQRSLLSLHDTISYATVEQKRSTVSRIVNEKFAYSNYAKF